MRVENVRVYDLDESIKASKYPMSVDVDSLSGNVTPTVIGLASSPKGMGHDQFLTGIRVALDLTCSNKMWVEMERYRFVEFVSSQSTMHRITKFRLRDQCNGYVLRSTVETLEAMIEYYNNLTDEEKSSDMGVDLYLKILYNVPMGLELTARLTTNYRALKTVYAQRKTHRLPEWREFCKWIESLPYFKEFISDEKRRDLACRS